MDLERIPGVPPERYANLFASLLYLDALFPDRPRFVRGFLLAVSYLQC